MGKVVGFTYDLKTDEKRYDWLPDDFNAEFDTAELVNNIAQALELRGHQVIRLGNIYGLLAKTDILQDIDIVFNIAEGVFGRNRESQIPVILEMLNVPFVGSDGLTLGISLDKLITKKILIAEGINTPKFFQVHDPDCLNEIPLDFPLIVKPRHEGSSKGITKDSVVENIEALRQQAQMIITKYRQPALVEEFIEGREFTVAVLGDETPEALPPVQITIDKELYLGNRVYTFDHIRTDNLTYICPAKVSANLKNKLKQIAVAAYQAIECRDFGRVDIRVNDKDIPYVLEINPLPSLSRADVFTMIAKALGISWEDMINKILDYALKRCEIMDRKNRKKEVLRIKHA